MPIPAAWLARLPKAELHCHLIGSVRAETFAELAQRERLALPADPLRIYADINSSPPDPQRYRATRIPIPQGRAPDEPDVSYPLFQVADWVLSCLRTADDLTRLVYEAFEDAYASSNVRHLELFFDELPAGLRGLGYAGSVRAYEDGIQRAERDFGMTGRMIAAIDRSKSGEDAVIRVREVLENPSEYVAGIGLDNLETAGPPQRFAEAFRLAGDAGLRRTAHASEHVPNASNTLVCLDELGCDRIDHGYFVLEDPGVVEEVRDRGVVFTVASTTSRRSWRPWRRASIEAMIAAGLSIVPCSDDPGMFPTTLNREYDIVANDIGSTFSQLRAMALRGFEASWLPETERSAAVAAAEREIAEIDREFGLTTRGPRVVHP
jgi:adenosine deaminase